MQSRHWTGDDDREADPDVEPFKPDERCRSCGADEDEDCDERCNCDSCIARRDIEPGDPDGEDYCRDRDAEYRDAQTEAVKLK